MGRYGRLASDCPWKSHIAVRIIEVYGLRLKDSPNLPCDALQGGSFIEDMIIIYVTLDVKRKSCTRRDTLYNGICTMQNIISDNLQPLSVLFSPMVRSKWCTSANRIFLPTPLTSFLPTPFASFLHHHDSEADYIYTRLYHCQDRETVLICTERAVPTNLCSDNRLFIRLP